NRSALENLMFEVVFSVLPETRMKRQTQQAIRTALVEKFRAEVGEQRLGVSAGMFFQKPDFPGLMNDKERVAQARHLPEPDQPVTNIAGLVDKRMRETQLFAEERPHADGLRQFADVGGHAEFARQRGLRLFERNQIFDEV